MIPKRKLLPIIIIPLDRFGEDISEYFMEEINLSEPQLILHQWLKVLPKWSSAAQTEVIKSISTSLLLNKTSEDTPYQSAVMGASYVTVILIGSFTLSSSEITSTITSIAQELREANLFNDCRFISILDISKIPGESLQTEQVDLQMLDNTLNQIKWPDFVYLVHNRSEAGFRASNREEISEAIRLFMESLTLGNHWNEFEHSWLNRRVTTEKRFASFSVFSMSSPKAELLKYFSHVSFYEVIEQAAAETTYNPNLPQLGDSSIPVQDNNVSNPVNHNRPGISKQTLRFEPGLRPKLFEPKHPFWLRVEDAIKQFKEKHFHVSNQIKDELVYFGADIRKAANQRLDDFIQQLNDTTKSTLTNANFVYAIFKFSEQLRYRGESITINDESFEVGFPQAVDLEAKFKQHRDVLFEMIRKLPNASSLLIIAGSVCLMQVLITFHLINLWDINSVLRMFIFWLGLAFWVIGGIYLAWRLPAWRIKHFIEENIERTARLLSEQLFNDFHQLKTSLAKHLQKKNLASEKAITTQLGNKLFLTYKYLEKAANDDNTYFPYPNIQWERVRTSSSPFHKYLEDEAALNSIIEKLHKEPQEFQAAIVSLNEEILTKIENEDYQAITEVLMREIRGIYATVAYEIPENLDARIQEAKGGWSSYTDQPLLNINPTFAPGTSGFLCICNNEWDEVLHKALSTDYTNAIVINMMPKDRIYFIKVFNEIALSGIVQ